MAERVCPWWMGYLLASPLRRLLQDPRRILEPYIEPGMVVLDLGCGMGFFSLEMARIVGPAGKVVCVDLQPRMIQGLVRRAERAGVADRIDPRVCGRDDLGLGDLEGQAGFALAFALLHEVPDQAGFWRQVHRALRPGGTCLVAEPRGHVSGKRFERTIAAARQAGFEVADRPGIRRARAALIRRTGTGTSDHG